MNTGVRLTQLAKGEPLLGMNWTYMGLNGIEAVDKRLEELFIEARRIGFNYIIDTIRIQEVDNKIEIYEGVYGSNSDWKFNSRIESYRIYSMQNRLKVLLEIDVENYITNENWKKYADFIINNIIIENNWVKHWQILVEPDKKDHNGNYYCEPIVYTKLIKYIYEYINDPTKSYSEINIGGPGIYNSLIDFFKDEKETWINKATGDNIGNNHNNYDILKNGGFLKYIDFFTFLGKQDTIGLNYKIYNRIIDKLNLYIERKIHKKIPLFSTDQGWKTHMLERTSNGLIANKIETNYNTQGYYEIREILNCAKSGITPFIRQLIDEVYDPKVAERNQDDSNYFYGIIDWDFGSNKYKPAYQDYKFILPLLRDFNIVVPSTESPQVTLEDNLNIDSVCLKNNSGDRQVTILWSKNIDVVERIVLSPHHIREYIYYDDSQQKAFKNTLMSRKEIFLNEDLKFVLVFEDIIKSNKKIKIIEEEIERKIYHTENTLEDLIRLLPNTYNKETSDVNYYKLLRSLSLELSDAKFEIEKLKDNLCINTVHDDAIYNNFGSLVNLEKKSDWSYDKYRRLVKGTMESLLKGPTMASIKSAIELFTDFEVKIWELGNVNKFISEKEYNHVKNSDFVFVVEVKINIDKYHGEHDITEDANYILNIIKPAHTISIIIQSIEGREDYREYFKKMHNNLFKDSDRLEIYPNHMIKEGVYGWELARQFKTANVNDIENSTKLGSNWLIGPKYILVNQLDVDIFFEEEPAFEDIIEAPIFGPICSDIYDKEIIGYEDNRIVELIEYFNEVQEDYEYNVGLEESYKIKNQILDFNPLNIEYIPIQKNIKIINYSEVDIHNEEIFREIIGIKNVYHQHKRITKIIKNNQNKILLPIKDLFSIQSTSGDELIKVYINGVLQPHWHYDEIPSMYDNTKAVGIKFIDETIYPGDIVTIIYQKDSELILEDFPFIDEDTHNINIISDEFSTWKQRPEFLKFNISTLNNTMTIDNKLSKGDLSTNANEEKYKITATSVAGEMYIIDENNNKISLQNGFM
ncbi:MAG: hypothetical protein ACOCRK_00720 [bacterium]